MIGIDIEETHRFINVLKKYKKNTLLRIFSEKEIVYCLSMKKPHIHLCGKFCAKEAFIKATNKRFSFNSIEVLNNASGAPEIYLNRKRSQAEVSISHTENYAVAVVICETI